jgi:hypothetical protein
MKLKLLEPKQTNALKRPGRDALWLAVGPLLAALLAVSIALTPSPAKPISSQAPRTIQSSAPGPVIDPVVHNIGKYVASHQILWPELSRHTPTQLSSPTADKPPRWHR